MDEPTREAIKQWSRILPKGHPLRCRCERNSESFPGQAEIVDLLLDTFRDTSRLRGRAHDGVAFILGKIALTPEQKVAAALCLSDELVPCSPIRNQRLFRMGLSGLGKTVLTTYFLGYLIALYVTTFNYSNEDWDFSGPLSAWTLFISLWVGTFFLPAVAIFMMPVVIACNADRVSRMRTTIANTLGVLREPGSVIALAQAACDGNTEVRSAARKALFTTLPHLTPEYYGTMSAETTPNLCRILEEVCATKPDFAVTILQALEKVGDGRAVETLEHRLFLAPVAVRREADRILPLLRERKRQEEAQSMLLRASSEPSAPQEQLLRPVTSQPAATAPEQLLRAAQSPQE